MVKIYSLIKKIVEKEWKILLFFAFVIITLYANSLNNGFVSDDIFGILNNPHFGTFQYVVSNPQVVVHSFIKYFIFIVTGSKAPFLYRFPNMLMHIVVTISLYFILTRNYSKKLGFFVATLFAVHPIDTESITWISGGQYSIMSAFFLSSLLLSVARNQQPHSESHSLPLSRKNIFLENKWLYILSAAFYLLGSFTSPFAVTFILIFLAYNLMWPFMSLKKFTLYALITSLLVYISFLRLGTRVNDLGLNSQSAGSGANLLYQIPIAITEYLKLIFWPADLTLYHTELFFTQPQYLFRLSIFLAFIGFILFSYIKARGNLSKSFKFWLPASEEEGLRADRRRNLNNSRADSAKSLLDALKLDQGDYKFIFFWLFFFIIALLPTLTPFGISWIVAERYVYLSSIGIFAVIGLIFYKLSSIGKLKYPVYVVFALVILSLSVRTIIRNNDWQNEDTLWVATVKKSPSSPQAHNNMGDVYGRHGDLENSAKEFRRAIELKPGYADAYHNLANTYQQMALMASQKDDKKAYGKLEKDWIQESINNYGLAVKYNPLLWQSYQNLAGIFYNYGQFDYALEYIDKAISANPSNLNLYLNKAIMLNKIGRKDEANNLIIRILDIDPNYQPALSILQSIKN